MDRIKKKESGEAVWKAFGPEKEAWKAAGNYYTEADGLTMTAGRILADDWSEKGNGSRTTAPRL